MAERKRETKDYLKKQVQGHKRIGEGLTFEKKMGQYLSQKGYKIYYEKKIGEYRFDVFGVNDDNWTGESYYIIECKNKSRVTLADIIRFKKKLDIFYEKLTESILINKAPVIALLAYTGELPADAKDAVKGFKPLIQFKKF
jgi:hypothetical protein